MFVLFMIMNDLAIPKTGRHGTINMYADDTTLYAEAETAEQAMEALGLQMHSQNGTGISPQQVPGLTDGRYLATLSKQCML